MRENTPMKNDATLSLTDHQMQRLDDMLHRLGVAVTDKAREQVLDLCIPYWKSPASPTQPSPSSTGYLTGKPM